nr:hypothetical protein [Tanacetum cinerariifolium]
MLSLSSKSVNNEASIIDANPLTSVHPSDFIEDVVDFDDAFAGDNKKPLVGTSLPPLPKASSKVAGEASDPLDVDSDPDIHEFPSAKQVKDSADYHWVVAYVTPPSWKKHLYQISIKQLCDIHDRAYMRQVVLDHVLNSRTQKLIYALYKATTLCDVIRAKELEKDKAYAELERKCNEALLDLDKNPLVADMQRAIETLQRQRERLKLSKIQVLQEMDALKHDMALVVAKVVPDAATKLILSDEMGILVVKLVKASILYGRCADLEEINKLKEPFVMEKMAGYRPFSKQEYDQAGDDLANESIPSFMYSWMRAIQLSSSFLTVLVISCSVTDLFCMTSTKTFFVSFEKVIDATLLRASAFLFCSLLICSIELLGKLDRRPIVFSSFHVFSGFGSFLLAPSSFSSSLFVDDVSARKSASICTLIEFLPLNFILRSPNSMVHLATRFDFFGFARTCFISMSLRTCIGCAWKYLWSFLAAYTRENMSFSNTG